MDAYRTIFMGTLLQKTALSVGGNEEGGGSEDMPLCRDGLGRPTLTGRTLAGALIATARKIFDEIPETITSDIPKGKGGVDPKESLWEFFTAHPVNESITTESRQGVGIIQATGATAREAGALYDLETLPRGTGWRFLLVVDTAKPGGPEAEKIAAATLLEWSKGLCWVGRSPARGLGWMELENLEALRLEKRHFRLWPDSSDSPENIIDKINNGNQVVRVDRSGFNNAFDLKDLLAKQNKRWRYVILNGRVIVGESQNGYGLDGLSISGHATNLPLVEFDEQNHLHPKGINLDKYKEEFNPDTDIVMTVGPDGQIEPFIPGASLRGPLRHKLSSLLRSKEKDIRDPNIGPKKDDRLDEIEKLFGATVGKSSSLLISDAYLAPRSDGRPAWRAVWLQHHAEDEFTAGVYGTGKFDRIMLTEGRFDWKMVIEAETEEAAEAYKSLLKKAEPYGRNNHLALGGGKWRGSGWINWEFDPPREETAGETE